MNTAIDALKIWQQAQPLLKERLGETIFETWVLPLRATAKNKETLVLEAPDQFFRDWAQRHYKDIIQETVLSLSEGRPITLAFDVNAQPKAMEETLQSQTSLIAHPERLGPFNLNPRYTFDNFVVGPSNRHAHAYSLAVAGSPAKAYNPLFIYGGVGLGKTHLIQAICNHIKERSGNIKIVYLPSESFTNELISAIQHRSTSAFRQKYRNANLLVIDDVHFFAGRESTQEEFFNTFNALYDAHKQIVLSSDRPPKEIANLQERLVSRFGWGLTIDIQPPDLETRVAILKKKIEREPVSVPDEVIFFIAQLIKTNIRELEGALVRTMAYSLMEEEPITLVLAKQVLKDLLQEPKKLITIDFIQRCVAEEFGVSLQELKTKRRNKTIVLPRQVAMYLSRELTDLSLPEIGEFFGGKDHTTVLHSFNKIKGGIGVNGTLKDRVDRIIQIIKR
ncbi:MAG: chromosomal replication initiator protein DnaA [Candidatus Omnitrophota bacterium]